MRKLHNPRNPLTLLEEGNALELAILILDVAATGVLGAYLDEL